MKAVKEITLLFFAFFMLPAFSENNYVLVEFYGSKKLKGNPRLFIVEQKPDATIESIQSLLNQSNLPAGLILFQVSKDVVRVGYTIKKSSTPLTAIPNLCIHQGLDLDAIQRQYTEHRCQPLQAFSKPYDIGIIVSTLADKLSLSRTKIFEEETDFITLI